MMLALSIVLHALVIVMCVGGMVWSEYRDNFGERIGMGAIAAVCAIRVAEFHEYNIADRSDVALAGAILLFGWGMMCAKLANRRRKRTSRRQEHGQVSEGA